MASVRKSLLISTAERGSSMVLMIISTVIIARLLTPQEIGIFSIGMVLVRVADSVRDFGVSQYIICTSELTKEKMQTAQGITLLVASGLGLVLVMLAQPLANFYGELGVYKVVLVLSANFFLLPLCTVVMAYWHREMSFGRIYLVHMSAQITRFITVLTLALTGFSYMSMAWSQVAGTLAMVMVVAYFRPEIAPLRPSMHGGRSVVSFSSKAMSASIAREISEGSPELVIGKLQDVNAVGLFGRAVGTIQIFEQVILASIRPVILPYFSKHKRQGKSIKYHYLQALTYVTGLAWPFYGCLFFLAGPVIRLLYGPQWVSSVPIAEILCFMGVLRILFSLNQELAVALSNPGVTLRINIISGIFKLAILIITVPYGLKAAALGLIAATIIQILLWIRSLQKLLGIDIAGYLQSLSKSMLVTLVSVLPIMPLWFAYDNLWDVSVNEFVITALGAAGAWIIALWVVHHPLADEITHALRAFRKNSAAML
ncbi:polysaccharide biosynthesis protein [Candidatus Nitrosoglobus terrae]|uniref:Polysaccharide biosynthesis protein n=1 Tax=Candidatus Nitrosoglobus terrae TaxID=1630141 RepID=A0A1Q2SN58_9GAMM|nr:lipopolysaccharide biosynthesis protein [Candidatus Nitrosoglobus terrae]BAW80585.1 polysaccharide biosynthesis protein [Candidatus Nitrosoglobus terrae]